MTIVLTGASRGIGRALALELAGASGEPLLLVARDGAALEAVADEVRTRGGVAEVRVADLSSVGAARALAASVVAAGGDEVTLVNNAGVWPAERQRTEEGYERAFAINHLAPLALTSDLLAARKVARVFTVGAGLMIKGRIDPKRTPTGEDFSAFRTYCTTKLCFALASKDLAEAYPEVDFAVGHPGVVRTELGDRSGVLGGLMRIVKRRWESPEACAHRLAGVLRTPRWSKPGESAWCFEARFEAWPEIPREAELRAWLRTTLPSA